MALIEMDFMSGEGGISEPELIWANPDHTVQMAEVTLDETSTGWVNGKHIDDYDAFIILTKGISGTYGSEGFEFHYIPTYDVSSFASDQGKTYYSHIYAIQSQSDARYTGGYMYGRLVNISSSGINIKTSPAGNPYCIPMYIWGLKGQLSVS